MKGHRDRGRRRQAFDHKSLGEQKRERARQASPALVLESMNRVLDRALVGDCGAEAGQRAQADATPAVGAGELDLRPTPPAERLLEAPYASTALLAQPSADGEATAASRWQQQVGEAREHGASRLPARVKPAFTGIRLPEGGERFGGQVAQIRVKRRATQRAHRIDAQASSTGAEPGDGPHWSSKIRRPAGGRMPPPTSADPDLITRLQSEFRGRPGRELDDALRAPHKPHHSPPRGQPRVDLLHPLLAVEEHAVDCKPHEDHGHAATLAWVDPHPASWWKRAAEHEADAAAENGAGDIQLFGQHFAGAFMNGSGTRHLDGVA